MVTTPKVLIIDDSNIECLIMRQALQGAGYQVLVANDGQQGMRILAQENPQCLILDIVLPGISGFELCRQVRGQNIYNNMPIIMVSTKNSSSDRFWAKRQGANQYLPKPFNGDELVKVVKDVLGDRMNRPAPSQPQAGNTGSQRPVDKSQARVTGPQRPVDVSQARVTGPQRPVDVSQARVTGPQRPVNMPQSRTTGVPRSSGSNLPSSGGINFSVGTTGTAGPQTPLNARSSNSETGAYRPLNEDALSRANGSQQPAGQSMGQSSNVPFSKLIPHRNENAGLGWSNKLDNLFITDQQARELYMVIDGQKNVEVLSLMTLMSKDEMIKALRILLTQQRIMLFDPSGHPVDTLF